jgi:hypothetical protein
MPLVTLRYVSSGSNTAASGTNTPATAVTDVSTGQTISTATSTTHTFSAAVNLTGVANDGSDVIWINTPAGNRHLFRITSFTGGVSTCTAVVTAEAATGTGGTLSWAIGGRRLHFENDATNRDIEDGMSGWRFELGTQTYQSTGSGSDQRINLQNGQGDTTNGPIEVVAAAGATPTITWDADSSLFFLNGVNQLVLRGLTLTNSTSIWGGTRAVESGVQNSMIIMEDCTITCSGQCVWVNATIYGVLVGNDLRSTHSVGLEFESRTTIVIVNNRIHDCSGNGIEYSSVTGLCGATIIGNQLWNNGGNGIRVEANFVGRGVSIQNNVCHGNTSAGIRLSGATYNAAAHVSIINNILTSNGTNGISVEDATRNVSGVLFISSNAYHGNTSGQVSPTGLVRASEVTLTATPFVDASAGNFLLNDVAGAGRACKDTGLGYSGP